jgi:small subunit ribosomal protein S6
MANAQSQQTITKAERRAREYETIYILRSSVASDEAERITARMKEIIETRSGKILKIDNWGRRKLAYPINKASRGVFVFLSYIGFEDVVAELERNLRLLDSVVRFQTVLNNPRVDPATYAVDTADLVFRPLEDEPVEEEPSVAARLGLLDRPRREGDDGHDDHEMDPYRGGGGGDDDADDVDVVRNPAVTVDEEDL